MSEKPIVVAVTGGTGFLGRHLLKALAATDFQVRALTRQLSDDSPQGSSLVWIQGDLGQQAALKELVQGADLVVHLAGAVRGATYENFAQVNVKGSANLIEAVCRVAPQAKVLLLSSLAARHPELSYYARSKRAGEILFEDRQDIFWTIFRPTAIYGLGDKELLPWFRMIAKGVLPVIGGRDVTISLLYINDLVSAILAWMAWTEAITGQTYELADGHLHAYSWLEIGDIIGNITGRSVTSVFIPRAMLMSVSWINRFGASVFGYAPMLTPGKVREILHSDWRCSLSALSHDLHWLPGYQLGDALKVMPNWH